jgi:hypothetical protein
VWWMVATRFFEQPVTALPDASARLWANPTATGHGGGHDLHPRTLRAMGVTLVGRFLGASGGVARFGNDLAASIAWGDERYLLFKDMIATAAVEHGVDVPDIPDPEPFDPAAPDELDLSGVGAVIFAGGFRPDYASWLPWTAAFDGDGFPIQRDGASSVVPNLYFIGVHFLRKRKSSLLYGVGEDAAIVADRIAAR